MPYTIWAADQKNPAQIDREIREARSGPVPFARARRWLGVWVLCCRPPSAGGWAFILRNPHLSKRLMGTALLTAVGMFGRETG